MRVLEFDTITEILSTMKENKLRTFLTGFAVAWGIFMLIILLGSGNGLKHGIMSNFQDRAMNSMQVRGGRTTMPYKGYKSNRRIQLTNDKIELLKARFPEIDKISGEVSRGSTISYGKESGAFQVIGVQPDYKDIEGLTFSKGNGRFFNYNDMQQNLKVIVISQSVANILFKNQSPLGKWVKVGGLPCKVIGIDTKETFNNEGRAFMPMGTVQKLYQMGNVTDEIMFTVNGLLSKEDNENFASNVQAVLGRELIVHPDDLNSIGIRNQAADYVQTMTIFSTINLFVLFIGICTLIAGIVGVGNIMVITVKERTREFGIRKALGATPGIILNSILLESIVITSMFGYIGMMLGIGVLELVSKIMNSNGENASGERTMQIFQDPSVDLSVVVGATILLMIAGLIAGYIPARKAVHIKPIEAMRAE